MNPSSLNPKNAVKSVTTIQLKNGVLDFIHVMLVWPQKVASGKEPKFPNIIVDPSNQPVDCRLYLYQRI